MGSVFLKSLVALLVGANVLVVRLAKLLSILFAAQLVVLMAFGAASGSGVSVHQPLAICLLVTMAVAVGFPKFVHMVAMKAAK